MSAAFTALLHDFQNIASSASSPKLDPDFLFRFCIPLQLRKERGWPPCVLSPCSPALTLHPSVIEASLPLWDASSSHGNGGRRRVRSSSRPQLVLDIIFLILQYVNISTKNTCKCQVYRKQCYVIPRMVVGKKVSVYHLAKRKKVLRFSFQGY